MENRLNILRFHSFPPEISHGFTTRVGGVSAPPYDRLNLGWTRPDARENILENYRRLCAEAGFSFASMALVNYVHGDAVLEMDARDCGRGIDPAKPPLPPCDGFFTRDPDVTLVTLHADCLPVYIYDPDARAVGLAHAGWKGTLLRIGRKLVQAMAGAYGTDPRRYVAGIGPGICTDCFEVDAPLAGRFEAEFGTDGFTRAGRAGKMHVNLRACMRAQLRDAGIAEPEDMPLCTGCTPELFSHRRDRGHTGAMAAFIKLL